MEDTSTAEDVKSTFAGTVVLCCRIFLKSVLLSALWLEENFNRQVSNTCGEQVSYACQAGEKRLNIIGLWTLHFDWGPKGNYCWTPLYFNFDGTFAYLAGANEGSWVQVDEMIILRFKRLAEAENNTLYSGSANRNFMSGIMMSSQGDKGHWYAIKKGSKVFAFRENAKLPYLVEKEGKLRLDPTGKEV